MTATTVAQCVAYDGLVDPSQIPGDRLDATKVNDACVQARAVASSIRSGINDVSVTWNAVPAQFQMPGAEPIYSAMSTPGASLVTVASKLDSMASALEDFATEVAPLRTRFDDIRTRAQEFVDSLEPGNTVWMDARSTTAYQWDADASAHTVHGSYSYGSTSVDESYWHSAYDAAAYLRGRGETARVYGGVAQILVSWLESSEHVGINNSLMDEIADVFATLTQVEAECANRINGLREDACVAEVTGYEGWELKQDGVELPWGAKVEETRTCGEQVGNGFIQFGKGTVEGLGSLTIGYNPMTGDFWDWGHAGDSWYAVGDTLVSLAVVTSPAMLILGINPTTSDWYGDRVDTTAELGKSLVAWDTWEDNPAQAATETALNIVTAIIPVGGAAVLGVKTLSKAAGMTRVTSAITTIETAVANVGRTLTGAALKLDTSRLDVPDIDTPDSHKLEHNPDAPETKVDTDPEAPPTRADDTTPSRDNSGDLDTSTTKTDTETTPTALADDAAESSHKWADGNSSDGNQHAGNDSSGNGSNSAGNGGHHGTLDPSSDEVIRDFIESHGMSEAELHDLRRTPVEDLTDAQVSALSELRGLIPPLTSDTPLVKVIPLHDIQKYLSNEYEGVRGFIARAEDIDASVPTSQVVQDLRLDYVPNSGEKNPFTGPDVEGHGYIEFTSDEAHKINPAQSARFGGTVEADAPYTGNGFVGNADNTWRPEYTSEGVAIKAGAKLWQVGPGGPRLVALFDGVDWIGV